MRGKRNTQNMTSWRPYRIVLRKRPHDVLVRKREGGFDVAEEVRSAFLVEKPLLATLNEDGVSLAPNARPSATLDALLGKLHRHLYPHLYRQGSYR